MKHHTDIQYNILYDRAIVVCKCPSVQYVNQPSIYIEQFCHSLHFLSKNVHQAMTHPYTVYCLT